MTPGLIYASSVGIVCELADAQGDWCEWCMTQFILETQAVSEQ